MTPGYAKSRDELPWLPYPESDKILIINAHNFEPPVAAFSPAVNSKMPIAAWIPTRTQSADDLVGTNNGTLTNGASIVADSGAGGTEAFGFDAANDTVLAGTNQLLFNLQPFTISWWEKATSVTTFPARFRLRSSTNTFAVIRSTAANYSAVAFGEWKLADGVRANAIPLASAVGQWVHFVIIGLNGPQSNTPSEYQVFSNNAPAVTSSSGVFSNFAGITNQIGWDNLNNGANCRMDDIRIFDQALTATDVADLYAAGLGRGVDAS